MTFAALAGGAYDAPPDPLVGWGGNTLSPFTSPRGLRRLSLCIYCLNCTKFGQLILLKIVKIVATRCQILRLKCTNFEFGWGSAPDPAGGAYSTPPDSLAGFKGPTSKGRKGMGW